MITWKDVTSHSRNATDRTPRSWEASPHKHLRIVVTRKHGIPGTWYLDCESLGFYAKDLQTDDIDEAKTSASAQVVMRLSVMLDAVTQ